MQSETPRGYTKMHNGRFMCPMCPNDDGGDDNNNNDENNNENV